MVIHKLDAQGQEILSYSGMIIEQTSSHVTLEARFERPNMNIHGLRIDRGDRFVETFYPDRWFNIFAIYDFRHNRLRGWYCNITRPARILPGHLFADDLALDMIVFPDGRWLVLDEEEFASLELTLAERQRALRAVTELQEMVIRREGPFALLGDA